MGEGGSERLVSKECSPQKFSKNFFGSGCGVVLKGWGVLVIRDLWSVLFWG